MGNKEHRKGNRRNSTRNTNLSEALLPRGLSKVGSETTRALLPLTVTVIPLCALIVCGLGFWMIVAAPAYIRGVECNVLFTIQKALTGSRLYTNPNELPFDVAQYSPLYYLICQAVSQLFGISPIDAKAIFSWRGASRLVVRCCLSWCFTISRSARC